MSIENQYFHYHYNIFDDLKLTIYHYRIIIPL